MKTLRVLLVSTFLVAFASSPIHSKPPKSLAPREIGIHVKPYEDPRGNSFGVLVIQDNTKRKLWQKDDRGNWRKSYFRVNRDVVLAVNGKSVSATGEIKEHLVEGKNALQIWDSRSESESIYFVYLND